ncbi:Universal stress A family [Lecanosticta acicola]|uniref:Universal stress A family n=1 Tax=Lecanosticta acicola TaxID=111012 RepID=A0AAI9E4D6_9PEZI|nr:Universal stress A family [Lecanosticta acicola]
MSAQPSPRAGTPAAQINDHEPSPRSQATQPTNTTSLPDRSIPAAPFNSDASSDPPKNTIGTAATSFVPAWRRPTIQIDGASDSGGRRPSVQFVPHVKETGGSRSSSAKPSQRKSYGGAPSARPGAGGRRLSSPPPPPQFRPSVSFDTFSNPSASDFSLTLNRKHKEYTYTKRSRTFLCGTDTNEYSDTALEWLIDELVDDGDEVVCLRVVEKDSKEATKWSGGQGEKGYRREAQRFLQEIEKKNTDDRAISLVLEFSIGRVQDTIQQMIRIYEPAMLVVGTRGRSLTGYQGLLSSGSVSKYCLQYSPVPVIVVRPSSKREAKKRKRLQDPSRSGYRDILDKSEETTRGRGGHLLDANNRLSIMGSDLGPLGEFSHAGDDSGDEARRVAEAIGYSSENFPNTASLRGNSLTRLSSARSERSDDGVASPPGRLLKSPELGVVDSPPGSDDEDDLDEEDVSLQESIRPQDEAAQLAYEAALKEAEEVRMDAEARAKRDAERSASRNRPTSRVRGKDDEEEGGGAAILGLYEQLKRGM